MPFSFFLSRLIVFFLFLDMIWNNNFISNNIRESLRSADYSCVVSVCLSVLVWGNLLAECM